MAPKYTCRIFSGSRAELQIFRIHVIANEKCVIVWVANCHAYRLEQNTKSVKELGYRPKIINKNDMGSGLCLPTAQAKNLAKPKATCIRPYKLRKHFIRFQLNIENCTFKRVRNQFYILTK